MENNTQEILTSENNISSSHNFEHSVSIDLCTGDTRFCMKSSTNTIVYGSVATEYLRSPAYMAKARVQLNEYASDSDYSTVLGQWPTGQIAHLQAIYGNLRYDLADGYYDSTGLHTFSSQNKPNVYLHTNYQSSSPSYYYLQF